MNFHALTMLPLTAERGWPELVVIRPRLLRLFMFLVLPLSLIPPAMLWFAGSHHPEMFAGVLGERDWASVASAFFVAEIASVAAMGWFVRQVAGTYGLGIDRHDAYLLASIAPVPMWLSALSLFIPNIFVDSLIAIVGFALSCGIVYHGITAICRIREDVVAAGIVQTVIGAGLVAWAFLLVLALA